MLNRPKTMPEASIAAKMNDWVDRVIQGIIDGDLVPSGIDGEGITCAQISRFLKINTRQAEAVAAEATSLVRAFKSFPASQS